MTEVSCIKTFGRNLLELHSCSELSPKLFSTLIKVDVNFVNAKPIFALFPTTHTHTHTHTH